MEKIGRIEEIKKRLRGLDFGPTWKEASDKKSEKLLTRRFSERNVAVAYLGGSKWLLFINEVFYCSFKGYEDHEVISLTEKVLPS